MAVNENLYSWMLKTYGMGAAEWYRSNPTKPSGANPFLPKGSYVPQAKKDTPGAKGPRGETLASVSPDIIEESIIEPAPIAQAETEDQKFERYYNQAKQQYEESKKGKPTYTAQEFPSAKLGPNISYMPEYGQYGGYFSKENLRPLTSLLYNKYQEVYKTLPSPYDPGNEQMLGAAILRNNPGLAPDYSGNSPETLEQLRRYDEMMAARDNAFKQYYEIPLSQAKYKSSSEAPSRAAYRQQLVDMGFDIPLVEGYTYFERAATPEDYEPQYYGLENVGRSDYRQQQANAAIAKNFEILEQQAASGNQASQAFLDRYTSQSKGQETPAAGPRGEEVTPVRGPRGEDMGEVASILPPAMSQAELYRAIQEYSRPGGPAKGSELRDLQREWIERQKKLKGAEAPTQTPKQEDSDFNRPSSAFDEQKALIAAQAAGSYRKRGDVEDPFRSGAVG